MATPYTHLYEANTHKIQEKYHRIGQPRNKSRYIHLKTAISFGFLPSTCFTSALRGIQSRIGQFLWLCVKVKTIPKLVLLLVFHLFGARIYRSVLIYLWKQLRNGRSKTKSNAFFSLFLIVCWIQKIHHLNIHQRKLTPFYWHW